MDFLINFSFDKPYFLGLPILFLVCAIFCKPISEALIFPHLEMFNAVIKKNSLLENSLKWMVIIFSSIALATPVVINRFQNTKNLGLDIAIVLDASGSMAEKGYSIQNPNLDKFSIAKSVASRFIESRKNDNISLIIFGDYAIIASPLSFDKRLILEILNRMKIGIAGEKTAINDALAQMAKSLQKGSAKSKVGIFLTDGMNTAGTIPQKVALSLIEQEKIKLYTIGFGKKNEIDEPLLKMLANNSGGKYFHAQNDEVLAQIYELIDSLEKSEIESQKIEHKKHYFIYPLFIATLSLLFLIYLKNRRTI